METSSSTLEEALTVSPFDNEISLIYKAARKSNSPARLMIRVVRGERNSIEDQDLNSYLSIRDLIPLLLSQTSDLAAIYSQISNLSPLGLSPTDLAMSFLVFNLNSVVAVPEEQPNPRTGLLPSIFTALENSLPQINALLVSEGLSEIRTVEDLQFSYLQWSEGYSAQLIRDADYLDYLIELQKLLAEQAPLPDSDLGFDRVTVAARPTFLSRRAAISSSFNGTEPSQDLADEIFDQAIVSREVPFLSFTNSEGKTSTKLWNGGSFDMKTVLPSEPPETNSFFLLVWSGQGQEKVTKESFSRVRYDLSNHQLLAESPIRGGRNESVILGRISASLPIQIGETSIFRLGGGFRIYGAEVVPSLFLDMVLNQPIFYSYVYVEESYKPSYEKKKLILHFRSVTTTDEASFEVPNQKSTLASSVVASVTQFESIGEKVNIRTPQGIEEQTLPVGTSYLSFNILRADNRQAAQQFQQVINRLIRFYLDNVAEVRQVYTLIFPEASYQNQVKRRRKERADGGGKITILRQLAPDIFVDGYARKCQCKYQPIIIPNEEVEDWQNKTFERKGQTYRRQVLRYPRDNPRFNFVCPNDAFPYPGVKANRTLPNFEEYPYIPCCEGSDQMAPTSNSYFREYYQGVPKTRREQARKGRITTSKIVSFGRDGSLPAALTSFLSSFFNSRTDFARIGVPRSINSLISCLLLATQQGVSSLSDIEIENFSRNIRRNLAVSPFLLKQELYDLTPEEISFRLTSNTLFFDPALFYRALEEVFAVNIYTFTIRITSKNNFVAVFDVPRHRLFHARIFRSRPAVLIYKNVGSESDALVYPQCELIRDELSGSSVFGEELNAELFRTFTSFHSVSIWSPPPIGSEENGILSSILNYSDPVSGLPQASSQIVDDYGKLRGLNFEYSGNLLTVYFPPSQPLNLLSGQGRLNDPTVVLTLFPGASGASYEGVSEQSTGRVTGIWFPAFGSEFTFYFPIAPVPMETFNPPLKVGPPSPFPSPQQITSNLVTSYDNLRLKRDIFLQLISWFFLLTRRTWPQEGLDDQVGWFRQNFISIGNDSQSNYSFDSISRILPTISTIDQATEFLNSFPGMIRNKRIYLYNAKFAEGILYFLKGIVSTYSIESLALPQQITSIPFQRQPFTSLFENWEQLQKWNRETSGNVASQVRNSLSVSMSGNPEPFYYLSGKLYLVQNVKDSTLGPTLNVAITWQNQHVNPGFFAETFQGDYPPYRLYYIKADGKLAILQDKSEGSDSFIEFVDYGGGKYAALLPLN